MEKVKITLVPNGPAKIEGEIQLQTLAGDVLETKALTYLCRCGKSNKKPYCDGTHKTCEPFE
jgi:CDGSH-type Zn-finger protein